MLTHIPFPLLPIPPSWFPGHMMKFTRMLPNLLTRTDVVLELRDARLPLTSINRTLEGALQKWRAERGWNPNDPTNRIARTGACERIVVLNKRDLVPAWGMEPFRNAMAKKFPDQQVVFASWNKPRDIRDLNQTLVNIARRHPHAMELNVLVIGMPNVGKSTLLNTLRHMGIKGPTPKAFQTSAQPGLTQALSTRLKLSLDPLIYAFDTPGVMLPFLGKGEEGAERGVKLALIAGIKEGLYDTEALAAYLLYRLNILNPISPAYLRLLPPGTQPTADLDEFLTLLAQRMNMVKRGALPDLARASVFFVKWWRAEGGLLAAESALTGSTTGPHTQGWGFDFEWAVDPADAGAPAGDWAARVQGKMEACMDAYAAALEREEASEGNVSATQERKQERLQEKLKRQQKYKFKAAHR